MINQIYGLFDFIQTNGSIKRFTERTKPRQQIDQSQHGTRKREQGGSFLWNLNVIDRCYFNLTKQTAKIKLFSVESKNGQS